MNLKKFFQQTMSIGFTLWFLVACGTPATPVPTPTATGGRIEGAVTLDGDIGKPLANVEVFLNTDVTSADPLKEIATTKTDSQGKYSFENVEPGGYVIGAAVKGKCMILELNETLTVEVGSMIKKDLSLSCSP